MIMTHRGQVQKGVRAWLNFKGLVVDSAPSQEHHGTPTGARHLPGESWPLRKLLFVETQ
jgi:hypothetical protein